MNCKHEFIKSKKQKDNLVFWGRWATLKQPVEYTCKKCGTIDYKEKQDAKEGVGE